MKHFPLKAFAIIASACQLTAASGNYTAQIPPGLDREWVGAELWANPMPDWRLSRGEFLCEHPGGNRNLVVLTRELSSRRKPFILRVTLDQRSATLEPSGGWTGFQAGLQGRFKDYRDSAVFGRGFCAGVDFAGRLFIGAVDETPTPLKLPFKSVRLELSGEPTGKTYRLTLRALDAQGVEIGRTVREQVQPPWLEGLVAIAVSTAPLAGTDVTAPRPEFEKLPASGTRRGGKAQMAFRDFSLKGAKSVSHPDRAFGPVLWCQHSLQNNGTLKVLAQFPPLGKERLTASLELDGRRVATEEIEPASRTALFRVEQLDTRRKHPYAVVFKGDDDRNVKFTGTIRPVPSAKKELIMAALSCNDGTGFPHNELMANVASQHPGLLVFLGDQIYEGNGGYGVLYAAGDRSMLDYLRKLYLHGWVWRDLMRDVPTIAIPDDHDVFHGNLWGNGGRKADLATGYGSKAQDSGGYKMPSEFVNVVHRTQSGNLPDPFDPTPCDQGISVYYTSWEFGPLDMAILGDRQWKSAPKPLLPEAHIFNGFVQNPDWNPRTQAGHPDAELLGPRQERFLEHWAAHRPDRAKFRIVLSQTPWNCMATLPEGQHMSDAVVPSLPIYLPGEYPTNDVPTIDFDASGWPKAKRDLALRTMNKAGVLLHIAGDQHLGSTGRYGIAGWNDGPYWIATPATANLWPRRWFPREPGGHCVAGAPRYTGDYEDQFGNRITVLAVANPQRIPRELPIQIGDRAPGYAIVRFSPANNSATLECWPYWAAPGKAAPNNAPYPGWPILLENRE